MVLEGKEVEYSSLGRKPRRPKLGSHTGGDLSVNWQKEILWAVVTEGIVERETLTERLEEEGAGNVELEIEGMIANGFLEDINGFLRIHPDFAENCYAVIR